MPKLIFSTSQDRSLLFIGSNCAFYVLALPKFERISKKSFEGNIGMISQLGTSNIITFVGGGIKNTHDNNNKNQFIYKKNVLLLWDDYDDKVIGGLNMKGDIIAVSSRPDYISILRAPFLCIYRTRDLQPMKQYHIVQSLTKIKSYHSLLSTSTYPNRLVLAFPGLKNGQIRVEIPSAPLTIYIQAFQNSLSIIKLSDEGTLIATYSEEEQMIKLFDVVTGNLINSSRIGSEKGYITSLAFSKNSEFLAGCSSSGWLYIFNISREQPGEIKDASLGTNFKPFVKAFFEEIPFFVVFGKRGKNIHLASKTGYLWTVSFTLEGNYVTSFSTTIKRTRKNDNEIGKNG